MNELGATLLFVFVGGVFGASIGALWAFVLCTTIAVMGCLVILAGGTDYILMQVALGPIFSPAYGGFLSGVIAATYAGGIRKNHPTNSPKDIVAPLMGTSWDVLFVGGVASIISYGFTSILGNIPILKNGDTGAISIVLMSILARVLFLKETPFGNSKSIEKYGIFGTNEYALSWVGWMTPKPLLIIISASMGGFAAAIAMGTQEVLAPLVEAGKVSAGSAYTVSLFFTWGISGIMLTMMTLGQGVVAKVPVTHAMSLVGALMFLKTGSLLCGVFGGVMGMAVQEFGARVFWNHGGNHIDPPAFSIAINTLVIYIFFTFIYTI